MCSGSEAGSYLRLTDLDVGAVDLRAPLLRHVRHPLDRLGMPVLHHVVQGGGAVQCGGGEFGPVLLQQVEHVIVAEARRIVRGRPPW